MSNARTLGETRWRRRSETAMFWAESAGGATGRAAGEGAGVACLGPQTAPQVLPVEVPSAAGAAGRVTSKGTVHRPAPNACAGITDLNLFLRSTDGEP